MSPLECIDMYKFITSEKTYGFNIMDIFSTSTFRSHTTKLSRNFHWCYTDHKNWTETYQD